MSDSIVSVYSDARTEYTKQLCAFLVPAYFQFFLGLLEKARSLSQSEPKKVLWHYQTLLNDIPEWNMEKVSTEINTIQTACGCDYLEDLLTAVFIAHTKVLTAIRLSSNKKKVQITVPKVEHFLFKVLCETSKLLWGSTYLFRDDISSIEKQQNYRSIEGLLQEGTIQAVRSLVPVKSILKDFVSNDEGDDEDEEKQVQSNEIKASEEESSENKGEHEHEQSEIATAEPTPTINDGDQSKTETAVNTVEQPLEDADIPIIETPEESSDTPVASITPQPTIIRIDDGKSGVSFANYDAVFDSDNPDKSDMVNGIRSSGLEDIGGPEEPLSMDDDLENLDEEDDSSKEMPIDEYEVLV